MKLEELIAELGKPDAYQPRPERVDVHQTHISAVFLAGEFVYKVKKPLRLSFLDYSTLELRRHYCEEEVRLNRRLAPDVYLGVTPVVRRGGNLFVEGPGEVVEWAVKMRRLPDEATLRANLDRGPLAHGLIEELGRRIAAFHASADRNERISASCRFANIARLARDNFDESVGQVGTTVSPRVFRRLTELTESALERLRPEMDHRAERGLPCENHGDLRLDHIYIFPERPPPKDIVIIDGIEFNDAFRFGDPAVDMAFLVMELVANDHRDLAAVFHDAYASASGDHPSAGLVSYYVAYRAMVRGKVNGMKAARAELAEADRARAVQRARAHWLVALGALEPPGLRPCLVLVGGLPGTGKTTLARELSRTAEFQVIRTDQVRKELARSAGLAGDAHGFEEGIYSPEWTDRTYQACLDRAEAELFEGRRVLVDATFGREVWRNRFLEAGVQRGIPTVLFVCEAKAEAVQRRLELRKHDLSDADWTVHLRAAREWEPPGPISSRKSHVIDTTESASAAAARAIGFLRESGLFD